MERAKDSTDATIIAQELLTYITSCDISDWRGSIHDFVLNWKEQNRRYVAIIGTTQSIVSITKDYLLCNAVRSIPAFKNMEDIKMILEKGIGNKYPLNQ